ARGIPGGDEPRQHGVQAAARRRPDVRDRLLYELQQVVSGALALDREQREHGGLGRRELLDRFAGARRHERTLIIHAGIVQYGLWSGRALRRAERDGAVVEQELAVAGVEQRAGFHLPGAGERPAPGLVGLQHLRQRRVELLRVEDL